MSCHRLASDRTASGPSRSDQTGRRSRWGLCCLALTTLLGVGACLDDVPSEGTTPRRRNPVRGGGGGTGGTVGSSDDTAVPGGLAMRGGAGVARPAPGVAKGSAAGQPPWKGGAKARVVIEEFTDFECPFCRRGWKIINQVLQHYGARVKLVFRHLPLVKIHLQAMQAAEAAVCAQRQGKFWEMQDLLFRYNQKLSRADLIQNARRLGLDVPRFTRELDDHSCKAAVLADMQRSQQLGVGGTPAFIVNGTKIEGAHPFATFKKMIDAELAN
ncbi:MAG: thioredoxin domain-containing protein [bacterium]